MKKLIRQGALAMILATVSFAVEAAYAVHGTVSRIDSAARPIVVNAADGTEHTLHFVAKTVVHGTEVTARDTFHGLKEGSEIVARRTLPEDRNGRNRQSWQG